MTNETTLTYQVYVTPILATAIKDITPGQSRSTWSPISVTLISGRFPYPSSARGGNI
jgi:hypothetical protein